MIFNETSLQPGLYIWNEIKKTIPENEVILINNLKDLMNEKLTPKELMKLLIGNEVKWPSKLSGFRIINTPYQVINKREGTCVETSILIRQCLNAISLNNTLAITKPVFQYETKEASGHCFPIFQDKKYNLWFIFNYLTTGHGTINGPFKSKEKLIKAAAIAFAVMHSEGTFEDYMDLPPESKKLIFGRIYGTSLNLQDLKKIDNFAKKEKSNIGINDFLYSIKTFTDFKQFIKDDIKLRYTEEDQYPESIIYENDEQPSENTIIEAVTTKNFIINDFNLKNKYSDKEIEKFEKIINYFVKEG